MDPCAIDCLFPTVNASVPSMRRPVSVCLVSPRLLRIRQVLIVWCESSLFRMKPTPMAPASINQFLFCGYLLCLVLCNAVRASVFDFRVTFGSSRQTPSVPLHVPELEAGFHLLYQLKFDEARNQFELWRRSHPEDSLGSAAEAASYLFEECYRQGILTSGFFLDDRRFLGKIPLKPDPELRASFFAADKRAQDLAQLRLKTTPNDTNALPESRVIGNLNLYG
jgi:hypothetical protein